MIALSLKLAHVSWERRWQRSSKESGPFTRPLLPLFPSHLDRTLDFSHDSEYLAFAAEDNIIEIVNVESGAVIPRLIVCPSDRAALFELLLVGPSVLVGGCCR